MKVVFAGPSIAGRRVYASAVQMLPPATFGDVERAVLDGAHVIGIIDGRFQQTASVWHKEILLALSRGVTVLGAASMGALRAAECEVFGMVPVGVVADAYARGELVDDGDVALVHETVEFGYRAVTEPLVNVIATAHELARVGVSSADVQELVSYARQIHFADRTLRYLFATGSPVARLESDYCKYRVDQKAIDADLLIDAVASLPDAYVPEPRTWRLLRSRFWEERTQLTAS